MTLIDFISYYLYDYTKVNWFDSTAIKVRQFLGIKNENQM